MKNYVLVHGGWEGSFFWKKIKDALIEKGHKVKLVDLPGSYGNEQSIDKVTLENYVTETLKVINEFNEKVILVGHSLAGIIISDVAEKISKKIEKLIYVTAPLLKNGESLLELMQSDLQGQMLPRVVFSEDMSYGTVDEDTWREVAFHDVEEEVILDVLPKMADKQATEPFMTKSKLSEENFGSVPKIYVRTINDRAMSIGIQDQMIKNWKVDEVRSLVSGHFPTFSVPNELLKALL